MNTARPSAWKSAMGTDDSRAGLERLVEDLVVVPKKILGAENVVTCWNGLSFDMFRRLL
jgi:hypothetical protein